MKHRDHSALAHRLMAETPQFWHSPVRRRAFLTGSILPDFNPLTYLRGFRESRRMKGHNTQYSEKHIRKVIRRLRKSRIRTVLDCYVLGTLIHYLADSFTYPHTEIFRGTIRQHTDYENRLHHYFRDYVERTAFYVVAYGQIETFLEDARLQYERDGLPSPEKDAEWIFRVCGAVYFSVLPPFSR